jgi:hypothetical protein
MFRTLLEVLFRTEKLLSDDKTRRSVRQHILSEADNILTSRIKVFFSEESNLREGYYLTFKLLSLQQPLEKRQKAAEYWYYLFEMVSASDLEQDRAFTHDDIDEWIDFFCGLGDDLREEEANHAAAVKYYSTGISLIRTMLMRRNATLLASSSIDASLSDSSASVAAATNIKLKLGRLQLGSALLGTVLCTHIREDAFYTLDSKQQLLQSKLIFLNESRDIFGSSDFQALSQKSARRYEAEYKLANQTFDNLMESSLTSAEDMAAPVKKLFKRKKKKKSKYDMINPLL